MIIRIYDGWSLTPEYVNESSSDPSIKVSVIIPVRNEGNYIASCIESILNNDYPEELFEVIVVNDHSDDNTLEVLELFRSKITLISPDNRSVGKKAALLFGIEASESELIICTDGDCTVDKQWISGLVAIYEREQPALIAGMVKIQYNNTLISACQYLDFAGLMMVTANGITKDRYYLANGANIAFRKEAWKRIMSQMKGNMLASGDDMFLIQAMAQNQEKVIFAKDRRTWVTTLPEPNWSDLFNQRKRWAGKTKYYGDKKLIKIQLFVGFFHILIILQFTLTVVTGGLGLFAGLFMLFVKWCMDYLMASIMCRYFGNTRPLKYFIPAAGVQFIMYIWMGMHALFPGTYQWKDRKVA
ncbi:MAG TPA: glycosyltransferase [Saprospiraceae bacterium]|nr:glycosyltransferase [Saprospiraceae bacterium]